METTAPPPDETWLFFRRRVEELINRTDYQAGERHLSTQECEAQALHETIERFR